MPSIIAVNIQFNSPNGVFLSLTFPGIKSTLSGLKFEQLSGFWSTNQRNATGMGVVRHEVNKSAGSSEFIGNNSFGAEVGQRTIMSRTHFVEKDAVDSLCSVSLGRKELILRFVFAN